MRHLRLLHHICEVAHTGSIRRAAEALNLTPSAMNRRIQDLEAELGAALFERHPRGVRLTEAGVMFLRYARGQIAEAERLRSEIDALQGLRRGPIRIACSQAVAYDFLPSRIARFRAGHPGLVFDVKVMDHDRALAALAEYEADLALIFKPAIDPTFQVLASLPQRLVAIMRTDHPLAAQARLGLADCAACPVALPDATLGTRQLLDDAAARLDLCFDIAAESNSFEMLRAMVLRAKLVSFQIEIGRPMEDADLRLAARPIDAGDIPQAHLVLCQLRGRSLPVAAARFAEVLAAELAVPFALG